MTRRRSRALRLLQARPRLVIATVIALAIGALMPDTMATHGVTRWLIAWNSGTILYVVLAAVMMARSTDRHMRHRAQLQDDGQRLILVLAGLATVASLAAIAGELGVVRDLHGFTRDLHIALAGVTVLSSWAFIQTMFTLHYAHEYYAAIVRGDPPVLHFPDERHPGYGDFFYFSSVIGTSGQTADVAFVSKPIRRVGTLHCILAYFYNTTVLALLINIGASLL